MNARAGIEPMKALAGALPASDDGWGYEVKLDGYRTLAYIVDGKMAMQSSNRIDVTAKWPHLTNMAPHVNAETAIIDGEVVCLDEHGVAHFEWLQRNSVPPVFVAFDVLAVNGHDTMNLPFEQRRRLLEQLVEPGEYWRVSELHTGPGSGATLVAQTEAVGHEGVMAKRLNSVYVPGKRSTNWRKIKHRKRQEFVVGAFLKGSGSREATFGSFAVGYYEGERFVFCGTVGSGLTQADLDSLWKWYKANKIATCPFHEKPPRDVVKESMWVRPELVIEVAFGEWTSDGFLRHPVFLGVRDDKDPRQVTKDP
jgi:bifunctional non-homologous end joining protein LigD